MKFFRQIHGLVIAVSFFFASTCLGQDSTILNSFAEFVKQSDELTEEQKTEIAAIIQEYESDAVADAITESLIVMETTYGEAVEASDDEDLNATIAALRPFLTSENRFLAADASFYLARSLMNAENYEQAKPLLENVYQKFSDFNVHVGRAKFYLGIAEAGLLNYSEAINVLTEFVQDYPDAPERLRVAAWRQIQQLRSIKEGKMEDVYQRMDYSRRKLSLIEPGEQTQEEQKKIVNMLAKLIKEQQKEASQSKSKDQKNTQQQKQNQPQQQQAQQQQQQSKSEQGGTSNNPNGTVVKKAYDNGPASPWSRLRDRSRDPANSAIKDKLPAKYRDLVERYYEAANGQSNR